MSVHRKLETAANVAIIGVALAVLFVVGSKYLKPTTAAEPLTPGQRLTLAGVDWRANRQTLLVGLKEGCPACRDSAEFHRRVLERARARNLGLIALLPDQPGDGQAYVASLGLQIPDVRKTEMKRLSINVVPVLILVDDRGRVQRTWVGRLDHRQEEDVLRTIG